VFVPPLPPLPKRWRVVARCAVVLIAAAVLIAAGLWLRHDTKAANAGASSMRIAAVHHNIAFGGPVMPMP